MCGQGPNCLLEPPSSGGRQCVERRVDSFQKALTMLQKVATPSSSSSSPVALPPQVLRRAQLKSDALRLLHTGSSQRDSVLQSTRKACELLSSAMQLEMQGQSIPAPGNSTRLRELLMLRGRALGRAALAAGGPEGSQHGEAAQADFRAVIGSEPRFAPAYLELAKVCSFTGQLQQAVDFYRQALALPGLGPSDAEQAKRSLLKLDQRLARAPGSEEQGLGHSGDGSGRWKVARISGLSHDSCIYHLENRPAAEIHPFPHHAWHVQVWCETPHGNTMREYTPVSSAAAWEAGQLDLLVKTYPDGTVSKHFGTLRTFEEALEVSLRTYSPVEDQACWVTLSTPMLTLYLPALSEEALGSSDEAQGMEQLAIVAGGTGIAPALQLLREVVDPKGAFGPCCRATLLYSSRSSIDVLLLDELRMAEASAGGRVVVRHTLTDQPEDDDPWELVPPVHFAGRHGHFASYFQPFEPESGPLRALLSLGVVGKGLGRGEEAEFRGRLDSMMLKQALVGAGPGRGTRCVLCGPQGLLDAARTGLMALGHLAEAIVSLRASPTPSKKGAGVRTGPEDRVAQVQGRARHRAEESGDSSAESESGSCSGPAGRRAIAAPRVIQVSAVPSSNDGTSRGAPSYNVNVMPPSPGKAPGAIAINRASLTGIWSTHDAPPPLVEEWTRPPAPPPPNDEATRASTFATSVAPSWSIHVAPPLLDEAPKAAAGFGSKAAAALATSLQASGPPSSAGSFADRVLLANLNPGRR